MKSRITLSTAVAIFFVMTSTANAEVIFSQAGDDLLIDITAPISFTATADETQSSFVVLFRDVFSSPVTGIEFVSPVSGTSTMTIDGNASTGFQEVFYSSFTINDVDPHTLGLTYSFGSAQSLNTGDSVTISAGLVTATDYFLNASATLPDLPAISAVVASPASFSALTNVATIPEPSSAMILLPICAAGYCRSRRRRKTADAGVVSQF